MPTPKFSPTSTSRRSRIGEGRQQHILGDPGRTYAGSTDRHQCIRGPVDDSSSPSAQPEEATADDADGATDEGGTPVLEAGTASLDAASAADEVAKQAAAPVSDAKAEAEAEAEAARTLQVPGRAQASGD